MGHLYLIPIFCFWCRMCIFAMNVNGYVFIQSVVVPFTIVTLATKALNRDLVQLKCQQNHRSITTIPYRMEFSIKSWCTYMYTSDQKSWLHLALLDDERTHVRTMGTTIGERPCEVDQVILVM